MNTAMLQAAVNALIYAHGTCRLTDEARDRYRSMTPREKDTLAKAMARKMKTGTLTEGIELANVLLARYKP